MKESVMKNNWTLEDYKWIQDKKENNRLLMVVLCLGIIGIFLVLYKFNFEVYQENTLIKNEDDFLLIVESQAIEELKVRSYIYINNKAYQYEIVEIEKDYSNINNIIYQTIHIKLNNYQTDSIVTKCHFLKRKKSIYQMIIEFIKGGIG